MRSTASRQLRMTNRDLDSMLHQLTLNPYWGRIVEDNSLHEFS